MMYGDMSLHVSVPSRVVPAVVRTGDRGVMLLQVSAADWFSACGDTGEEKGKENVL
jgi:acyl-CoA synthetase (NDP forming)